MVALHNVRYEAELAEVCAALRAEGLSVLPLKGANLVALYPDYSMREVGDNDILYGAVWRDAHGRYHSLDAGEWNVDSPNRESVLRIMRELGYSRSPEGYECHLRFYKEPGLCFELHNSLFEKDLPMWRYYQNPWLRARALSEGSDPSLGHAFLFPPEDEYVYCLAHTFKHSLLGGYGLRALADIIVMNRAFGNVLDREYIREQLLELGILDFAESLERLGRAVYDGSPLTEDQEVAVLRMMECGTYGSKETLINLPIRGRTGPQALFARRAGTRPDCPRAHAAAGIDLRYRQVSCALSDSPIGPPSGASTRPAASRPGSAPSPTRSRPRA